MELKLRRGSLGSPWFRVFLQSLCSQFCSLCAASCRLGCHPCHRSQNSGHPRLQPEPLESARGTSLSPEQTHCMIPAGTWEPPTSALGSPRLWKACSALCMRLDLAGAGAGAASLHGLLSAACLPVFSSEQQKRSLSRADQKGPPGCPCWSWRCFPLVPTLASFGPDLK